MPWRDLAQFADPRVPKLDHLRRAAELAPDSAVVHHFLGFALAAAGDLEGARTELKVLEGLDGDRARSLAATIESAASRQSATQEER